MPKLKEGAITLGELKRIAADLKIKGRSKMKKKELMEAIEKAKGTVDEESTKTFVAKETRETSPPKKMSKPVPKPVPKPAPKRPDPPPVKREASPTRMVKQPRPPAPVKPQRRKY